MSISSSKSTHKKHSKQSLGKIYTTKRQPLAQILFYPKSALIDDYYLDHLHGPNTQQKQKVIKFVGDQEANIKMIMSSLDALNLAQNKIMMAKQKTLIENQFSQILRFFYLKIYKIRGERDSLKLQIQTQQKGHLSSVHNLEKDIQKLKEEIICLKKEKERLIQKLQNESKKKQYFERQNLILLEKQKVSTISSPQNFNLLHGPIDNPTYLSQINQDSPSLLDSQTEDKFQKHQYSTVNTYKNLTVNHSNKWRSSIRENRQENSRVFPEKGQENEKKELERILRKYNLQPSQLQDIIDEYSRQVQQNNNNEGQTFESIGKNFLSKTCESKSLNRRVKKDIDKVMNFKN